MVQSYGIFRRRAFSLMSRGCVFVTQPLVVRFIRPFLLYRTFRRRQKEALRLTDAKHQCVPTGQLVRADNAQPVSSLFPL